MNQHIEIIGDMDLRGQWLPEVLINIRDDNLLNYTEGKIIEEFIKLQCIVNDEPQPIALEHGWLDVEDLFTAAWDILEDKLGSTVRGYWKLHRNGNGDLVLVNMEHESEFLDMIEEEV